MTVNEPPYRLIPVVLTEHDWQFVESADISAATLEFDRILESFGSGIYLRALRRFVASHPGHIDALHHYASCLYMKNKGLEAYAFSQTAVAVGMRVFPDEFQFGRDRLDTGYISNRPFLRACQGLMLAQYQMGLVEDAIETGRMCLQLDLGDRMGARLSLPIYLLERGRDREALDLFERPDLKGSFFGCEYLHALALVRRNRPDEAKVVLNKCLKYYPLVARYLLDERLPSPPTDGVFGVVSGGEYEGWMHAQDFGHLWRAEPKAMEILRERSRPIAIMGWKRFQETEQ